jgi:hypothetical protein
MITAPGIYDIPTDAYLADPVAGGSLSSSSLRELDKSPQHFRDYVSRTDDERTSTASQDFGSAAHVQVLGTGHDIYVPRHDGRTKAGKAERKEAKESGAIIVTSEEALRIQGMTAALRADERAAELLVPDEGLVEHTFVFDLPEFREVNRGRDVMGRSMLDYLRHVDDTGQRVIVDYKTARSVSRYHLERAITDYGYYRSGGWYRLGCDRLVDLGELPPAEFTRFVLIFQESSRPYSVVVVPVDEEALAWGATENRKSVDRYLECVELNYWPGPARDRWMPLGLTHWKRRELEEAFDRGDFDTRADKEGPR